jgi:hypothetical protein
MTYITGRARNLKKQLNRNPLTPLGSHPYPDLFRRLSGPYPDIVRTLLLISP